MNSKTNLDSFGRPFPDYSKHPSPVVTVDSIVTRKNDSEILLITRGKSVGFGKLAFPGGHLDYNEDPGNAVLRELKEETGIQGKSIKLFGVRGNPERDPRAHYITIIYKVEIDEDSIPIADDDASDAKFYLVSEILSREGDLAFDHYSIIKEYFGK